MTQNLIINNDDDAEVVKFTVEIPDGFNSFKIDSINGTLINQDYLCVGDRLNFSFSNNPIMYNTKDDKHGWKYSTTLNMIDTNDMTNIKKIMNPEFFKFIALDFFNVYRVKFIPVYSYFDYNSKRSLYLFNPTDTNELRDDPVVDVENYTLATNILDTNDNIEASFAGSFIIALQKVQKIDDISITFGESINNSKTQFEDLGTINAAGEAVQENLASSAYTYGSAWRYNVANLIMNHRVMVLSNSGTITTKLLYFVKYGDDEVSAPYADFNYMLVNGTYEVDDETIDFYTSSNSTPPTIAQLNQEITLIWNNSYALPFLKVISTNPLKYSHVPIDPNATFPNSALLPNGQSCKILGNDLINNNYEIYNFDYSQGQPGDPQILECSTKFDIKPTAYYSGNVMRLELHFASNRIKARDKICRFPTELLKPEGYAIVPIKQTIKIFVNGVLTNVYFKFDNDNSINHVILGETFTTSLNGEIVFVYSINTGFIPSNTYGKSTIQSYAKQPLQLTEINNDGTLNAADDDILITHIHDEDGTPGLCLSTPTLTNNIYNVQYDGQGNPSVSIIQNPDITLPTGLFLPMKARQTIAKWDGRFTNQYIPVSGVCILMNQDNRSCNNLNDADSVYYLADGHETLNIEPPKEDDEKFKTFNGTVMFDRSSARITRLFANSQANACIGYINDILSAKLARYYFVADYNIYDSYISTKLKTQFTNSKDQMFNIYKKYNDGKSFNTGEHSVLLCSCFDLVKLIGSDTIVNNCMPSINPEQQVVKCQPLINEEITQENINKVINTYEPFKFFHYYNSGFNNYPYFGTSMNDEESGGTSIGGLSTYRLPTDLFISNNATQQYAPTASINLNYFKVNTARAKAWRDLASDEDIKDTMSLSWTYPSNREVDGGFISCVPIARVYRNANFEQSDLSISTGRMKTLSPIYIQSVSRGTIQNLIYMFDMMLHTIVARFCKVSNSANSFNYLGCLFNCSDDLNDSGDLPLYSTGVLRRFTPSYYTPQLGEQSDNCNVAFSLDSALMMNYLLRQSVNDYDNINDLTRSLPSVNTIDSTNEEVIGDMFTNSSYTNVQLFSSRYFNFYDNISPLSFVNYVQVLTQSMDLPTSTLMLYFGITDETSTSEEEGVNEAIKSINEYIKLFPENLSIRHNYNLQRTVKTLISKLGEFLEYPKIIFGTTLDFNNSNTVNIQTLSATKYISPFSIKYNYRIDPITEQQITEQTEIFNNSSLIRKQKQNISMFGVVFRYHQLSLGWAKMDTDIQEQYMITKAKGPKHFTLMLYDEYGREFPNEDTSQGFKNTLKLELTLYPG